MTTRDRWETIKVLFEAALERGVSERQAFVEHACHGDDCLRREVEALLAAEAAAGSFLQIDLTASSQLPPNDKAPPSLKIGLRLCDRFEIKRFLGAGGMGDVYEALDHELGQRIAIKAIREEISSDPSVLARFRREVYAARRITHPNVCRTFDLERYVIEPGSSGVSARVITFLTMELLEGETLAQRLQNSGPLISAEALVLAQQAARALEAAHEAGIIHCDLKPSNIFLTHSEHRFRAVVTDFGISRFITPVLSTSISTFNQTSSQTKHLAGTIPYMAPEQLEAAQCTQSSDLYSLGLVLYEAVTGARPFKHQFPFVEATRRLVDPPPPLQSLVSDISPVYAEAVSTCLKRNPAERFRTASELATFLAGSATRDSLLNTPVEQPASSVPSVAEDPGALLAAPSWEELIAASAGALRSIGRSGLALCLVALACAVTVLIGWKLNRDSAPGFNSVAVLPFVDLTKDPDLDYLDNGITTSLTNDLSQVSGLAVTAESVARRVDTAHFHPEQVGRDLNVKAILTGSIAKREEMLMISVELVNTADGSQIWGKNYSVTTGDLAAVQEEIAIETAFRLRMKVNENIAVRLRHQYATNATTYDEYLRGRFELSKRSAVGFESALKHFQAATDRDPNYAPAFAGLADCYALMAYNRGQPVLALLSNAKSAAQRALELDSTLGEAYNSLAMAETLEDFQWDNAETLYKRAILLNPNYVPAHTSYGLGLLVPLGRYAEAQAQFDYAKRLDPESLVTLLSIALGAYFSRHYDLSIQYADVLRHKYPDFEPAIETIASDYIAKGMAPSAVALINSQPRALSDAFNIRNALLGVAFARLGNRRGAREKLEETTSAVERGENLHYWLACLYAALGEKEHAVQHLEKAYEHRQASILFIEVDPLMDPLRHDEGFQRFLSKIHLK